jgi:hypothetical protein
VSTYSAETNLSDAACQTLDGLPVIVCPGCEAVYWTGEPLPLLGEMGRLLWFRCRGCGIDFNIQTDKEP